MNQRSNRLTAGSVVRMILIAAFITAVIVFLVKFRLENLSITSGDHYSPDEIKEYLFTSKTDEYAVLFVGRRNLCANESLPIKLRQAFGYKDSLPFVEKIDVELIDRNSVQITVFDRTLIGCVSHMGRYFFFDKDGNIVGNDTERIAGIPEVTGEYLNFDGMTLNDRLDLGSNTIFNTIGQIYFLLDKNGLDAERIDINLFSEVSLFIDGNVFLLGNDENFDLKISNISGVINALLSSEGYLEGKGYSFDMRHYSDENMNVIARPIA